jgi:KaiC/GvpD/RAD55 family RecA-like ATPase
MAMLITDRSNTLDRFSPLERILRNEALVNDAALENGFSLLLSGVPGAGKTTVGLYLLNHIYTQQRHRQGVGPNVLLLSLVESASQIDLICDLFGLEFGRESATVLPIRFDAGEEPHLDLLARQAGQELRQGDLLFVDGISVLGTQSIHRATLLAFLDQVKLKRLFGILVSEEYGRQDDTFLEYAVDGIIRFGIESVREPTAGSNVSRWLEIVKMRWHDYYLGRHSFSLAGQTAATRRPGVVFFPSASCLTAERVRLHAASQSRATAPRLPCMSSGVFGFDELVASESGPFRIGDQILLIGPGGSGKFDFGAQFIAAALARERAVCVSFTRQAEELRVRLDATAAGDSVQCQCLHLSPTDLSVDELVGAIHNILAESEESITRLFIDGLSVLRFRFANDQEFESFVRSLLTLVRTFSNTTTIVSFHTARLFASYAEIDIPASELFATIVGFNFQEQFNRIIPGVVILKSWADTYDGSLKVPKRQEGRYGIDAKAGWSRVGLLSGAREEVHEERPFVKLFFENRSEQEVLLQPFSDFKQRYPAEHVFMMVAKPNPQPTHWSFRGYAGPGHSNTKVVQLRKYVMDVLRDHDMLLEVPAELVENVGDRYESGFLWSDSTAHAEAPVMIPAYADVGVLAYQADALAMSKSARAVAESIPATWEDMIGLAREFRSFETPTTRIRHLFIIPNTVVDYRSFVSFFFELCWTLGWNYPGPARRVPLPNVHDELGSWIDGPFFQSAIDLLRQLVDAGNGDAIPNPNIGGHYHEAVFARRWFSKIQVLPDESRRREAAHVPPFEFAIAPLPGVRGMHGAVPGVSNIDLYALGVIKEALAPETAWMLASSLLEMTVDIARARQKRGVPISKRKYETRWVQDSFCALVQPETSRLQGTEALVGHYGAILQRIVGDSAGYRRTADIPRFFELEQLLASQLPRIFDRGTSDAGLKADIKQGLQRIYGMRSRSISAAGR